MSHEAGSPLYSISSQPKTCGYFNVHSHLKKKKEKKSATKGRPSCALEPAGGSLSSVGFNYANNLICPDSWEVCLPDGLQIPFADVLPIIHNQRVNIELGKGFIWDIWADHLKWDQTRRAAAGRDLEGALRWDQGLQTRAVVSWLTWLNIAFVPQCLGLFCTVSSQDFQWHQKNRDELGFSQDGAKPATCKCSHILMQ